MALSEVNIVGLLWNEKIYMAVPDQDLTKEAFEQVERRTRTGFGNNTTIAEPVESNIFLRQPSIPEFQISASASTWPT